MFCSVSDRPNYDFGIPRYYEPLLPSPEQQEMDQRSFVYFIRCGEYVKIGFSSTPHARKSSIATSSPLPVEFIGLMEGDVPTEKRLHKQFKHLRQKLEWFQLTDELRAEIRRLCGSERKWRALLKTCA